MNNNIKSKIFLWLYRTFCYFVPLAFTLWLFVIEKLINPNITIMKKIGIGGIFVLVVALFIAIYFYKKHFVTKINNLNKQNVDLTDKILLETNEEQKAEYLEHKKTIKNILNKTETQKQLFNNILFIAPFFFCYIVCVLIEKEMISLRGLFLMLVLSMFCGFLFNILHQIYKNKENKILLKKIKKPKSKRVKKEKPIENQIKIEQDQIMMG